MSWQDCIFHSHYVSVWRGCEVYCGKGESTDAQVLAATREAILARSILLRHVTSSKHIECVDGAGQEWTWRGQASPIFPKG